MSGEALNDLREERNTIGFVERKITLLTSDVKMTMLNQKTIRNLIPQRHFQQEITMKIDPDSKMLTQRLFQNWLINFSSILVEGKPCWLC